MLSRRFACLLLGMWISGIIVMLSIDAGRLASVDRVLSETNPAVAARLKPLPPADARFLLTHLALEQNRLNMRQWESAQLVWGVFFFAYLLFGTRENKYVLGLALAMLAVVVVQRVVFSSELIGVGRMTDFVNANAASAERGRFWVLHNLYRMLELVKLGLAAAMAVVLTATSARRLRDPWQKINLVDKPDYGHVDG